MSRLCVPLALLLIAAPLSVGAQDKVDTPAQIRLEAPMPPAAPVYPAPPVAEDASTPGDAEAIPVIDSGTLPRNLSPWGMFMSADRVVKAVMIGLAFASVMTWTIWLVKTLEIAGARLTTDTALKRLAEVRNLDEARYEFARRKGPPAHLVVAALEETGLSADLLAAGRIDGIKERIANRLVRIESAAGRRLTRGTGVLASIGATAPFVGLFGTVWGIMNAFIGISEAETTNLAVVAPGIAEALLATAFGLVAAIPAVVIYNLFARSIAGYRARLADAAAIILEIASRDLDRGFAPRSTLVPSPARAAAE